MKYRDEPVYRLRRRSVLLSVLLLALLVCVTLNSSGTTRRPQAEAEIAIPTPPSSTATVLPTTTDVSIAALPSQATPVPATTKPAAPASIPATIPVPPKAVPVRLVIPSAGIDVPLAKLPMTNEQIAVRDYTAPEESGGYWVQFSDHGQVYNDLPGAGMTDSTFIVGHSCGYVSGCLIGSSIIPQSQWEFTRLSDPSKVKLGTQMSVFTEKGRVCAAVVSIRHVGKSDVAAQDVIFNDAAANRYIVVNTCDANGDINTIATLVMFKIHPCGG